ncbi:sugar kinase [Alteromonas sp. a30]|uniref:sugar kinase n=1 Tax=Alteromonas sp. a30 TaxID=2730917 RepID=UPI00228176CF|nr:sugar kinase [Alteromonas sp. a30]MCY7297198.1 sugar kinase [Alteromonas sp. a30]
MKQIVIFGECMVELINKDANTMLKSYAGDTYNTAIYLKRCAPATHVSYMTTVGSDFLSDELMLRMGEEEICTEYVYRSETLNLGLYMVRNDHQGERTFAYWRDNSAAKQTLNVMNSDLKDVGLFYFSGISLAILDDAQRDKLFSQLTRLKAQGTKIVFDPNYRERLWKNPEDARLWTDKAYAISDLAFPGSDDHLMLYGHTSNDDIFQHLAPFNIANIVIKKGPEGVHIQSGGEYFIVPVERLAKVVDATAAGDAFNGGFLAAYLQGRDLTDAVAFGAKVSANVISYLGAIIPKENFNVTL